MVDNKENFGKLLRRLWIAAIIIGAAGFLIGLLWANSSGGPGLDWIWGVAAFGFGAIVYNIAFFLLCSIYVPGMASLVEDDTEVEGDTVTHVVRHVEVGDETSDFYIRAYASARGTTAVAIISGIMIAVALYFF
jgi:hypothetical protein